MLTRWCKTCHKSSHDVRFPSSGSRCLDCKSNAEGEKARRLSILKPTPIATVREDEPDHRDAYGRIRSPRHLAWISSLASCCIPGCVYAREPRCVFDAHHLTVAQPKGRGIKSSDFFSVDVCRDHHNNGTHGSLHGRGDERAWWIERGVNPFQRAWFLWKLSPYGERLNPTTREDWEIVPASRELFPFERQEAA